MEFQGSVAISAEREAVWRFVTEPACLSHCLPSLTGWEVIVPQTQFRLQIHWGMSTTHQVAIPVDVFWEDMVPPQKMKVKATAVPNSSTTIRAKAHIQLNDENDDPESQTTLAFTAVVYSSNRFLDQLLLNTIPKQIRTFLLNLQETIPQHPSVC